MTSLHYECPNCEGSNFISDAARETGAPHRCVWCEQTTPVRKWRQTELVAKLKGRPA